MKKLYNLLRAWIGIRREDSLPAFTQYPFVRYAIMALVTFMLMLIDFWIFSSYGWRLLILIIWIALAIGISIKAFSGAETKELLLSRIDTYHQYLKRGIRKIKAKGNYDQLRRKVLSFKMELNQKIRNHDTEEAITEANRKLIAAQEELLNFENQSQFLDIDVAVTNENDRNNYSLKTHIREEGEAPQVIRSAASLKKVKSLIDELKDCKRDAENRLVSENFMPFVGFLCIFGLFAVLALTDMTIALITQDYSSPLYFTAARALFMLMIIGLAYYIQKSRLQVEKTDIGVKFFKSKPYAIVSRGPRLALYPFVDIADISTEVQRYDMESFKAKIADWSDQQTGQTKKRSQVVHFDVSILFHIERPIDAITELGKNFDLIIKQLRGDPKGKSERERLGIIGDHVQSFIRSFVAEWIQSLDDAYQVQHDMASDLAESLKENLEYLGIRIDNVFVTDVRGEQKIEDARNQREIANIRRDQAEVDRETTIINAEGKAGETQKLGFAQAEVDQKKGFAQAAVNREIGKREAEVLEMQIKAKIRAITSIDPQAKQQALKAVPLLLPMILGENVIPKTAEALGNTKFNIFAISDVRKAFEDVLGPIANLFGGNPTNTGGES